MAFLFCGNLAFAQEEGCDCQKGGIGLKIGKFVAAFGVKSYYSLTGCNTVNGVGVGSKIGDSRYQLGFGFDNGVLNLGILSEGPETTKGGGFSIGYDYGKCRLVWPITETKQDFN
jgi:hypothetical protein